MFLHQGSAPNAGVRGEGVGKARGEIKLHGSRSLPRPHSPATRAHPRYLRAMESTFAARVLRPHDADL